MVWNIWRKQIHRKQTHYTTSVFYCFTRNFVIIFLRRKILATFNLLRIFYIYTPQPYNMHAALAQILPILV